MELKSSEIIFVLGICSSLISNCEKCVSVHDSVAFNCTMCSDGFDTHETECLRGKYMVYIVVYGDQENVCELKM